MSRIVRARTGLLLVLIIAFSVLACLLAYVHDNKYTASGPQATKGLLVLDAATLAEHPVLFLTEGWAYYSGRLLAPKDFMDNTPAPDAYIYIGQYGGFEGGGFTASPHGSASYRLRIVLPDEPQTFMLELPEIFSAYRLYVNGWEIAAMGDPVPQSYRCETGNRTVSFEAGGEMELLFAVSDFSHLYSGMVYPPTFGQPLAVSRLLNVRLVLRGLVVAFSLAVGLLSVLIGLLSGNNRPAVLHGLLCLCFVGFASYPILRTLITGPPALNTVEMISFCAMLVVVMLLQRQLYGGQLGWSRYFIRFGVLMCLFSALLPLLLSWEMLATMGIYSLLVSGYELLAAAFITAMAVRALLQGQPHSMALLCGFLVFDTALLMDRILPLYEPVVGGWFYETASFVLILCVGAAVGQEVANKYRQSAVLMERQAGMERLARMQTASYELLMEKVEETKAIRHDLRHHFTVIGGFVESRAYEKLSAYVAEYGAVAMRDEVAFYTRNIVADVLLRHYAGVAKHNDIAFCVQAGLQPETGVADADLCAVLANLLENAVEACGRTTGQAQRFISIALEQQDHSLSIRVENSADGTTLQQSSAGFRSTKAEGRTGYGLSSILSIAERYHGVTGFDFDQATGVFQSTVLLIGETMEHICSGE